MDEFQKRGSGNRLDKLERGLYSRKTNHVYEDARTAFEQPTEAEHEALPQWKENDENVGRLIFLENEKRERSKNAFFKKMFLGALLFFILSLAAVGYIYFGGGNFVSGNNIDIQVSGPTTVAGGEEFSLDIIIKNGNRSQLESSNLTIEYPDGTRVAGDVETELTRVKEKIGSISAGGEARKTERLVLFGEKESVKQIKMTFEYRIEGSSATFYKDKLYDVAIKSTPVLVTIEHPNEINSNQNFNFTIEVASNSTEPLTNVVLLAEYPFGFTFQSATPAAIVDNTLWNVGNLAVGEKKVITIYGKIDGQNEEERTFKFSTGIASESNKEEIGALFSILSETVRIKKPFIGLSIAIKEDTSAEAVAQQGEKVQANIIWTNNLPTKLLDVRIEAKLSGDALDRYSVTPNQGGYYRSVDNTIVWEKAGSKEFSDVEPGYKGVASFSFASISNLPKTSRNPQINVSVSATGNQVISGGTPQKVTSTENKVVKINSALGFTSRTVRSVGPFENMGPVPPKADTETTYTILWDLSSSLNDLTNTTVSATLPQSVTWSGLISPLSEKILFDPLNNTITWNAGTIRAGTGDGTSARQVAFQVAITPSLSQVGSTATLLTNLRVTGKDAFSSKNIEYNQQTQNTDMPTDPNYDTGSGVVTK